MSASARATANQIYKSRLSLQRGGYGPRTGTPMSGAERARQFRKRRKAAAADLASTSTTGIPILMDVTNEQTIDISIGSATELRDVNISRSEAMQNHWRSADKRFKTVFEANPFVLIKHNVGDICLVDVKVEDHTLFILGAVYIHPKASAEAVKLCLHQSLLPYSAHLTKLIPNSQPDLETPIVLCGDFNCDPQQNSYLVEFMRNEFGLNYVQTSPTTLGNTTIDCTFTRNINVDIMPFRRLSESDIHHAEPGVNPGKHNPDDDEEMIAAFEADPTTSVRVVARNLNLSIWKGWSTMQRENPFHVSESSVVRYPLHYLTPSSPACSSSFRYPFPTQEASNALVNPLRLRVSMGADDHLLSDASHVHLSLENVIQSEQ
ncbi:hypothetical protein EVAR_84857_1 [Eumeta japonica]|uniref:Endonuclease/exonuclease/phosphatase domain-containing protein n=1 Tax=Eumeta variegata TaxID=151549 RepID=A0A4C1Z7I6_EUMVA|nr:hypothetical protein EVAR_84857_1 [Eumeta japonica]